MNGLRIWVDALALEPEAAGVGQYIRALMEAYTDAFPDDQVVALLQPGIAVRGVEAAFVSQRMSSARRLWYEQWSLRSVMRRQPGDVIHFPDYQMPLVNTPRHTVVTVHDLAAFVLPDVFEASKSRVKRFLTRRSVVRAQEIIVPSHATQRDLITILDVNPAKIHVIPHGVTPHGIPLDQPAHPRPYLLAVGTIEPRKNFSGLIRAYHLLSQRRRSLPDLLLAGRLGWLYGETLELPEKLGVADRVKFLQYVSEDTLATLYRDASGFVYPSFYEGFGLPVIEAMKASVPVVTSSGGALAEIGGNAVWRADPHDIGSIADQIECILSDTSEVRDRVQRARQWADKLTWTAAAEKTREVYELAVGGN